MGTTGSKTSSVKGQLLVRDAIKQKAKAMHLIQGKAHESGNTVFTKWRWTTSTRQRKLVIQCSEWHIVEYQ